MLVLCCLLCFCYFDHLWARQLDIHINGVTLLSNETTYPPQFVNKEYQNKRRNDHTNYSSRIPRWSKTTQSVHDASSGAISIPTEIHQPREDPKLFYQTASYLQEIKSKNINRPVSAIYPGREVTRAIDAYIQPMPLLARDVSHNRIASGYNICVRCPSERTLVGKVGSNRVLLESPQLVTCSGQKAPKEVRFRIIRGPILGSQLEKGTHMVIGPILYRGKILQICKIQVHVAVQNCLVPDYLVAKCDQSSRLCKFSCRDPSLEIHGQTTLSCGDNMGWNEWTGILPICRVRNWCVPPTPPDNGHLGCKGNTVGDGTGYSEGSVCRIICFRGFHWTPRAATVCRKGKWNYRLSCQPIRLNKIRYI